MKVIRRKIALDELKKMAQEMFGNLIKAVVDLEKKIMVVGADLHSDEEAFLLKNGSKQEAIWGINLYPEAEKDKWIEFDSMVNIRPFLENPSREVENPQLRKKIADLVNSLVQR